jgi:hypothetical protein
MTETNTTPSRVCTGCKIEKPATPEFFHAYKRSADGRRAVCKICRAKDNFENRDERSAKKKEHYRANRDRISAAARDYYAKNTEAQKEAARKRHVRNADRNNKLKKVYHEKHRDRMLAIKREGGKQRFKELYGKDRAFTIRHRLRSLMRITMTTNKGGRRMQEVLGYSYDELRSHLEERFTQGMTWERFLTGEIHIDHRIPVSYFKPEAYDCPEFRMCWSLTNLRPLWAAENISKADKLPDDFEELLAELRREVWLDDA